MAPGQAPNGTTGQIGFCLSANGLGLSRTAAQQIQPSASHAGVIAIRAGKLVDVEAGRLLWNQIILIEAGKITAVGPDLPIPTGATLFDLSKMTVLPGLVDCHTHLVGNAGDADPLSELKHTAAERAFESIPNARTMLMEGFTTVRDVGTYRAFVDVALRDAIARGDVIGPRMYVAGAYVTITGGGGAVTGFSPDVTLPWDLRFGVADGPDQVRQKVRALEEHDVDLIKVIGSGAFLAHGSDPGTDDFTFEEVRAAVEEAKKKGLPIAVHAHAASSIKNAVRAGASSIEHGTMIDDEGVRMMKEHGTYLVADIYDDVCISSSAPNNAKPVDFQAKKQNWGEVQRRNFKKAVEAGVNIAFGTDASVCPFSESSKQFSYQVKYGQTPMQAIQSATINAARLIGKPDLFGSIRAGKSADIVAVNGDPLQNINVLESVAFVMKEGIVFKQ